MNAGVQLLRGSPERMTNHKEQFQIGYLRAVAAAAGCVVAGVPEVDEGEDIILTHRSARHQNGDKTAYLGVQLKATSQFIDSTLDYVESNMRWDRYDVFRSLNPSIPRIVIIMSLPENQADWITASHGFLAVRHCSYWVNLAGAPERRGERPKFRAPKTNVFDDAALCGIMERVGHGGKP